MKGAEGWKKGFGGDPFHIEVSKMNPCGDSFLKLPVGSNGWKTGKSPCDISLSRVCLAKRCRGGFFVCFFFENIKYKEKTSDIRYGCIYIEIGCEKEKLWSVAYKKKVRKKEDESCEQEGGATAKENCGLCGEVRTPDCVFDGIFPDRIGNSGDVCGKF